MLIRIIAIFFFSILLQCGVYTFSGSTLPRHLKTIDIPLFMNQSLVSQVAEQITENVSRAVSDNGMLKLVPKSGDATIIGNVLRYENKPYLYENQTATTVTVYTYVVVISVEVEFFDNRRSKSLYKGTITEEGLYNFSTQKEIDGRNEAVKKIVNAIMQQSVQSW